MEYYLKIGYSLCNSKGELSLPGLLETVQDAFADTMASVGCDNVTLKNKYQAMWVFTKNKISVTHLPCCGEPVSVRCRSAKAGKIINYMLTEIIDKNGQICATSLLESCAIDIHTYRFKKLSDIAFVPGHENVDTGMVFDEPEYTESFPFTVQPTMIDYSRHMNNVQSVRIFLDSFCLPALEDLCSAPYEFVIHYNTQAKYNEALTFYKGKAERGYGYRIMNQAGQPVVKALLQKDANDNPGR